MGKIPVAVVGCGHLGTFHARIYSADPRCELVQVIDLLPERARRLAEELACEAGFDIGQLKQDVRAASVATPTTTHEQIARRLLENGIDLLVEKPLAEDPLAGARIVATAKEHGRVLAVGQIERCNPAFLEAKRDLATPRFVESHRLAVFVPRSLDIDVIFDLMIHDIDLVLSVASSPIEGIDAVGVPVITSDADIANARIRFADGSVANLTASRVSKERMRKIRFFDRNLYLSIDLQDRQIDRVRLRPLEPGEDPQQKEISPEEALLAARGLRMERKSWFAPEGNALATEIGAFLDACSGTGLPVADGPAGLASLEVALRVRESVAASIGRLGGPPSR